MNGVKIFLVGKEATSDTERVLESLGYEFQLTPSVEEAALQSLKKRNILILIESSSKEDFPEFFSKVKNLETPVIMLAENADELITPRGNQPYGYLVKPYHESELKFNINQAIFKKELERKFKRSEDILNISMNMAKMVYWEYDTEKDLFTFDDHFYALYGTTIDEQGGKHLSSEEYVTRFIPPEEQDAVGMEVAKALETDDLNFSSTFQHWMIRADGGRRYIVVRIRIMTDEQGHKIGTKGVNQDITEFKMAEEALNEADQRLAEIIDFLPDATFAIDVEGRVISWNRAIEEMTWVWSEEILGKDNYEYSLPFYGERRPGLIDLFNSSDEEIERHYQNLKKNGKVLTAETEVTLKGERRTVWVKAVPLEDSKGNFIGAIEAIRDITDLRNAEKKLKKSLKEKEILLKEIHHRVKNNLMIISSLLNLQSHYIKDKEALDVFRESQNRAKSMALIHERLYQSTDLKNIDFGDYIRSLTTDLYHSMVSDPGRVNLDLDLEDVKIDINTVVPLGLIVNELVTNSMKYAFPDDECGHIKVELHHEHENVVLRVSDNGVGFPRDVDYKNTNSLGLQLVNNLIIQIDGELELDNNQGTTFTIRFKEQKE
ncbi:histidine kinase dimerization/phosphoacceptor domain -containing protein [Methanobacterium subterraneum]|nr:histidine kinase dimerization/phosphoacceptor domain -containing protein [Methanobacterium subterraneum]